jgi:Kef-type K+ transport system membrane component KefB
MDILLQILLLLIVAKLLGELLEQAGYPALIGEILAGIVLGPSILNLVVTSPTLELFADIGIIALLFISGVDMNIRSFLASRNIAVSTAIAGVVVPFLLGYVAGMLFGLSFLESLFIAIALSITAIGVSVRTLIDLKRLNTTIGTIIVGAAVFDDIIGILMLGFLSALTSHGTITTDVFLTGLLTSLLFLGLFVTIGRKIILWVFEKARKTQTHEMPYSAAIIIAILAGALSHAAGLHYAIGAFIAGLILGDGIRSDRALFDSLTDFGFGFFVTLFFASIGLLFDLSIETLTSPLVIPIILLAMGGKIIGGFLGSVHYLPKQKALMVGLGLVPRGGIELVIAKIALIAGIIGVGLYSAITLMVIVTIILTPLILKRGFAYFGDEEV